MIGSIAYALLEAFKQAEWLNEHRFRIVKITDFAFTGLNDPLSPLYQFGFFISGAESRVASALDRLLNTAIQKRFPVLRDDQGMPWLWAPTRAMLLSELLAPPVSIALRNISEAMSSVPDDAVAKKGKNPLTEAFSRLSLLPVANSPSSPSAGPYALFDEIADLYQDFSDEQCLALCFGKFNKWKHQSDGTRTTEEPAQAIPKFVAEWIWCLASLRCLTALASGLASCLEERREPT